jgi:peptide/nickel transport system permease protein
MIRYIFKRFLGFIPTLFIISLFTFSLNKLSPGDPVEMRFKEYAGMQNGGVVLPTVYQELRRQMGLDKPNFYFSVINKPFWHFYLPSFRWNGFDNQYQSWISGFVSLNSTKSYYDGRPVGEKLWFPIRITFFLGLFSIILSFLISIPLGVFSASMPNSAFDKITNYILLIFYSVPTFWLATMAVIFFTNDTYHFKIASVGLPDATKSVLTILPNLILPVCCMSMHILSYITKQIKEAVKESMNEEYIKTARGKGLNHTEVVWRHAFRNALFPMISILGNMFPHLIIGSFVVEIIFNIPGMGNEAYSAFTRQDYPVLYALIMFTAIMTLIGNMLADILLTFANPQINLED